MKKLITPIFLVLLLSSCSSGKPMTHQEKQRYYSNQIAFYEEEALLMNEIGANGNESIYRDKVSTLKKQQNEYKKDDSFIDFLIDILFF